MTDLDPVSVAQRAELLCQLDRAEEALPLLHRALAANPGDADLWRHLSYVHSRLEQPSQALDAAARALELEPDEEWAHRLASLALARLGRHGEAVGEARQAARLDPDNWRTHIRLALALLSAGEAHRSAWESVTRAVRIAPHEPEVHNTVGALALAVDDYAQAEKAFRRVLELDPDNAKAIHNLALVDRRRGRLGSAAARFGDAVASDPRMHDSALAVDDSLLELLRRILAFTGALTCALILLAGFGERTLRMGYVAVAALLLLAGWTAYRQIPRQLRPHVRRLARRHKLVVVAVAMWCLAAATTVLYAFIGWFIEHPGNAFWVLLPALLVALPLMAVETRRLRTRMARARKESP